MHFFDFLLINIKMNIIGFLSSTIIGLIAGIIISFTVHGSLLFIGFFLALIFPILNIFRLNFQNNEINIIENLNTLIELKIQNDTNLFYSYIICGILLGLCIGRILFFIYLSIIFRYPHEHDW